MSFHTANMSDRHPFTQKFTNIFYIVVPSFKETFFLTTFYYLYFFTISNTITVLFYSTLLHRSTKQQSVTINFETEKIIGQIVGNCEWCDQNGDRVYKSNKSYNICMIRLKRLVVKYEKYETLSIYDRTHLPYFVPPRLVHHFWTK